VRVETLWQDLRYAPRQLARSPGFSLTAVLSLALGIGATTAVFSVLYAALMNPYPFVEADRIFRLTVDSKTDGDHWINPSGPQIFELRKSPVVDSVIVMDDWSTILTGKGLCRLMRWMATIPSLWLFCPTSFGKATLTPIPGCWGGPFNWIAKTTPSLALRGRGSAGIARMSTCR
jgi:hypothetical protein